MTALPELARNYDPQGLRAWVAAQPHDVTFCQRRIGHCLLAKFFIAASGVNVRVTALRVFCVFPDSEYGVKALCRGWQKLVTAFDAYRFPLQKGGDVYYQASRDEVLKFLDEYLGEVAS